MCGVRGLNEFIFNADLFIMNSFLGSPHLPTPTFAAPMTYTSLPLRSRQIFPVAIATPSPEWLLTRWQLTTLRRLRVAASVSHSTQK